MLHLHELIELDAHETSDEGGCGGDGGDDLPCDALRLVHISLQKRHNKGDSNLDPGYPTSSTSYSVTVLVFYAVHVTLTHKHR